MIRNRWFVITIIFALVMVPVTAELTTSDESIGNETYKITIDPIGDKRVGDTFTITAVTNLEEGSDVMVQVYGPSPHPCQKIGCGSTGGATGIVKVTGGHSGMNRTMFELNTSSFDPNEYIVTEFTVNHTVRANDSLYFFVLAPANITATTIPVTAPAKSPGFDFL